MKIGPTLNSEQPQNGKFFKTILFLFHSRSRHVRTLTVSSDRLAEFRYVDALQLHTNVIYLITYHPAF